jgi:long-subunit acyl-CoA synthetase (AMP-forming)
VGSVGTAAPGTEVVLADDGELLVRGASVMKGYRNDPEKTAEAIDAEGWMHTGDIGTIDDQGNVKIVDRKKELIINSAGKNMSPSNIENALKVSCSLVGSSIAIGDQRPFVSALITLDAEAVGSFTTANEIEDTSLESLAAHPGVLAAIEAGVEAANAKLSRVEHIRSWSILPVLWQPGGDELTPTMKLRRKPINEKYSAQIDALYSTTKK